MTIFQLQDPHNLTVPVPMSYEGELRRGDIVRIFETDFGMVVNPLSRAGDSVAIQLDGFLVGLPIPKDGEGNPLIVAAGDPPMVNLESVRAGVLEKVVPEATGTTAKMTGRILSINGEFTFNWNPKLGDADSGAGKQPSSAALDIYSGSDPTPYGISLVEAENAEEARGLLQAANGFVLVAESPVLMTILENLNIYVPSGEYPHWTEMADYFQPKTNIKAYFNGVEVPFSEGGLTYEAAAGSPGGTDPENGEGIYQYNWYDQFTIVSHITVTFEHPVYGTASCIITSMPVYRTDPATLRIPRGAELRTGAAATAIGSGATVYLPLQTFDTFETFRFSDYLATSGNALLNISGRPMLVQGRFAGSGGAALSSIGIFKTDIAGDPVGPAAINLGTATAFSISTAFVLQPDEGFVIRAVGAGAASSLLVTAQIIAHVS